jgi:hypothetical protein
MNKNTNQYNTPDKDIAELYFKLYTGCLKYKKEKDKDIDCDKYYKSFVFHSNKYDKNNK